MDSARVWASLKQQWAADRVRLTLWSPVALMVGVGAYFTPENEPPFYAGAAALGVCVLLLAALWRTRLRVWVIALLLIALGFSAAQFRAYRVMTPLLAQELHNRVVEATVEEINPVEAKAKLVLSHLTIEDFPEEQTPLRMRVTFRAQDPDMRVGDRIRFTGNLYPLPPPNMPGAYDFARHFYFLSIGGTGFSFRPAEILNHGTELGANEQLNNLRHAIGEDMRAGMPGATGTVAAAMTIGETGPIPKETQAILRDSGLAHMLSISGLHLAIAAGCVFFTVRLLLTLWPRLALRLPTKKIAAVFALVSAAIYLGLAGSPVPAQRAFIGVSFLFVAMLFDRRGITLRTLTLAATIILLLFPESMFGASFQMSFAATLAIVSFYESMGRRLHPGNRVWWKKAPHHAFGIAVTSLVATGATCSFVLYHFNRFALFGLISNMMVIPLATFIIMPAMVLALLLMPLHLQWLAYIPLAWGTDIMISVSAWVTALPYASLHLPSPTLAGFMLCSFGLLWLCLMRQRWRFVGLAFMALGLSTISAHVPADVLIGRDARQVIVRLDDGHYAALRGTDRSFTVQNWLRSEGEDALVAQKETALECDKTTCISRYHGHTVTLVKKPMDKEAFTRACAQQSDVLIAWWYVHVDQCPGATTLISRDELERYGAHAIRFTANGMQIDQTREEGQGHRLWHPVLTDDEEEEY